MPNAVLGTEGKTINTQSLLGPGGGDCGGDTDKSSDDMGECIIINHTKCHPVKRVLDFAFIGIF